MESQNLINALQNYTVTPKNGNINIVNNTTNVTTNVVDPNTALMLMQQSNENHSHLTSARMKVSNNNNLISQITNQMKEIY